MLIERLVRTTVSIHVGVPESHRSAPILGTERTGTGTIVDPTGLVLTANYVVLGANQIDVTLVNGETQPGRVVAQDFFNGIALVKFEHCAPCPATPLLSSERASIGQEVVIIASVGQADRRGNNGWITSFDPFDAYWEYTLNRAITTTAVNPGLGGAPLFDLLGNMIGVVALDLGEIGRFTLAVPVESYLEHREEMLLFGRPSSLPARAWVGLYCHTSGDHVVIAGVLPGGPAHDAGLKPGDLVLAVNDEPVSQRRDLYNRLARRRPGERLRLSVLRDSAVKNVEVASGNIEDFFA